MDTLLLGGKAEVIGALKTRLFYDMEKATVKLKDKSTNQL